MSLAEAQHQRSNQQSNYLSYSANPTHSPERTIMIIITTVDTRGKVTRTEVKNKHFNIDHLRKALVSPSCNIVRLEFVAIKLSKIQLNRLVSACCVNNSLRELVFDQYKAVHGYTPLKDTLLSIVSISKIKEKKLAETENDSDTTAETRRMEIATSFLTHRNSSIEKIIINNTSEETFELKLNRIINSLNLRTTINQPCTNKKSQVIQQEFFRRAYDLIKTQSSTITKDLADLILRLSLSSTPCVTKAASAKSAPATHDQSVMILAKSAIREVINKVEKSAEDLEMLRITARLLSERSDIIAVTSESCTLIMLRLMTILEIESSHYRNQFTRKKLSDIIDVVSLSKHVELAKDFINLTQFALVMHEQKKLHSSCLAEFLAIHDNKIWLINQISTLQNKLSSDKSKSITHSEKDLLSAARLTEIHQEMTKQHIAAATPITGMQTMFLFFVPVVQGQVSLTARHNKPTKTQSNGAAKTWQAK